MKKVLLALVLASSLAVPAVGLAACSDYTAADTCRDAGCQWNPDLENCSGIEITGAGDVIDLINRVGDWIFAILLAVAAIFLVVAGFFFVTAGGNPEQVNKARGMLINALIGVVIALVSRGLIVLITNIIA